MKKYLSAAIALMIVCMMVCMAALAEEPCDHVWSAMKQPTCGENGARGCSACGATESIPATGNHNWTAMKQPTCGENGARGCSVCGATESIPATGNHNWSQQKNPTCTENGARGCSVCGATESIPATGHNWKNGKCTVCGAGDPNYVKPQPPVVTPVPPVVTPVPPVVTPEPEVPSTYLYSNTMTSYGPMTRELIDGKDWYRVTPVDVSVDGVYTYDLIASNRYVVGTVTFKVESGELTVSYKVKANPFDVTDEQLKIYASKADLAEGKAVAANVDEAINIAENFGTDTKVIVSLILTGDYDSKGHYVVGMTIVKNEIAAMIASMD